MDNNYIYIQREKNMKKQNRTERENFTLNQYL